MVTKLEWTPALVCAFWDGVACSALDELSFGKVAGPAFLDLIGRYLRPSGTHLDFGAGSGHVMGLLLDRGLRTAGFDPSPDRQAKLVERLGQRPGFLGAEGLESTTQYDVVLLMEVIEHILEPDYPVTLERVARFVKPGGALIVSTPKAENLELANVFCPVSGMLFHPWQHVRSFTPQALVETFQPMGLTKEFLGLVDFSNDAAVIDEAKRLKHREVERAKQSREFLEHLTDVRTALHSLSGEGLVHWVRRALRPDLERGRQQRVARALAICQEFEQAMRADRDPADSGAPVQPSPDHEGVHLRSGHERTIVLVLRKDGNRPVQG